MLKQAQVVMVVLALPLLGTGAEAHKRLCGGGQWGQNCLKQARHSHNHFGSHDDARSYVLGFAAGYAHAWDDRTAHARLHPRRKIVRLAPGASYYHGQIDPWWRMHKRRRILTW